MEIECKITCSGLSREVLSAALRGLPPPISRPEMREIYNYRVESDGYYFVDRGFHPATPAVAMRHLVDAALAGGAQQVVIARL
jgi:hypothetical protein